MLALNTVGYLFTSPSSCSCLKSKNIFSLLCPHTSHDPNALSPAKTKTLFHHLSRVNYNSLMGKKVRWSWGSALIGATTATATAAIIMGRPKDPSFHLLSIKPTSIKLNLPVLHTDLILTVHVTNPNIIPIQYSPSLMSIFYDGDLLGTANVEAGSQPPLSCRVMKLSARLDGLKLKRHGPRLLNDVARREMALDAVVDIGGTAKVFWWDHKFKVHVDSHLVVDPLFLDVIQQENKLRIKYGFLMDNGCAEIGCPMIMDAK